MRRRRLLCPANLPPPSRRLLIRNHSPACPQNLANPPGPHHCQLPTKLLQPCHPCHKHQPKILTPIRICLLSLDLMVKLLLEEKECHKKFSLCLCHGIKDNCPPPSFDKSSTPKTNKPASTSNTPKPKGHAAQAKNASNKSDSKLVASANASDF